VGFSLAIDTAEISDRLSHLAQLVGEADDEALIRSALNDVGHIQQWIDNCKVALTRKLQVLATTTRIPRGIACQNPWCFPPT